MATKLYSVKRESNEGRLTPCVFSARLLGGSTVMSHYCLLGGDTAVQCGLYTRLCHTFLVSSCYSVQSQLIDSEERLSFIHNYCILPIHISTNMNK